MVPAEISPSTFIKLKGCQLGQQGIWIWQQSVVLSKQCSSRLYLYILPVQHQEDRTFFVEEGSPGVHTVISHLDDWNLLLPGAPSSMPPDPLQYVQHAAVRLVFNCSKSHPAQNSDTSPNGRGANYSYLPPGHELTIHCSMTTTLLSPWIFGYKVT